jgi:hypothetical protein
MAPQFYDECCRAVLAPGVDIRSPADEKLGGCHERRKIIEVPCFGIGPFHQEQIYCSSLAPSGGLDQGQPPYSGSIALGFAPCNRSASTAPKSPF